MRKMFAVLGVLAAFAMASPAMANPVQLAEWTFEVSVPTTAGPHAAEGGVNAGVASPALGWHANASVVYSNPVGNMTAESFSSNYWSVGDYYQFKTSTIGYAGISIEWDQVSSATGPRDFILQYSTNGTTFTQFGAQYIVLANAAPPLPNVWTTAGPYVAACHYSFDLSSVTALDNQAAVYFRLVDNSTVSANGGTVAGTGTDRVDTVDIIAAIPEPATLALLAFGSLMLLRRR